MKDSALKYITLLAFALILSACAPRLAYESAEWRVVALQGSDANVEVCYKGIVSAKTNAVKRSEIAADLYKFIENKNPSNPFTPGLYDATRTAYQEDGKLVIKESGHMRDPLSWSEQSGLNPLRWFQPSLGLNTSDSHIVKRGIPLDTTVIASNGDVMDSATYSARYVVLKTLATSSYDQAPGEAFGGSDQIEVIVWPGQVNNFYWKFSGSGYEKNWPSMAADIAALKTKTTDENSATIE